METVTSVIYLGGRTIEVGQVTGEALTCAVGMSRDVFLQGLPPGAAAELVKRARRRRFRRREMVFAQGEVGDCCHLIVAGTFAIRILGPDGDALTVDIIGPGDVTGELSLLPPPAPRNATCVSIGDGETLAVAASDFAEIRSRVPAINEQLLRLLAERSRFLAERLFEALHLPVEQRLVARLRELVQLYPVDGGPVVIPLSQDDLADLAGTSRQSVNKVLTQGGLAGAVLVGRGRITVTDPSALDL